MRTAASSKGVTVAVHDLGGTGDPLLICHANGFCGGAYGPLAAELAGHRHVWALDFRGHGHSTPPDDGDFGWEGFGDDLLAAVDALGVDRLDLFGHSMGGAAILLAERRRPGLTRSAYLYEPIVVPGPRPIGTMKNPLAEGARRRRDVFTSRAEALANYAGRPPLGVFRADSLAAYVEHGFEDLTDGTVGLRCRPEHEARIFELGGSVTAELAAGVEAPITVAVGRVDAEWSPAAFGAPLVKQLPHGRLVEHPLLDHFGPFAFPPLIAQDALEALGP